MDTGHWILDKNININEKFTTETDNIQTIINKFRLRASFCSKAKSRPPPIIWYSKSISLACCLI